MKFSLTCLLVLLISASVDAQIHSDFERIDLKYKFNDVQLLDHLGNEVLYVINERDLTRSTFKSADSAFEIKSLLNSYECNAKVLSKSSDKIKICLYNLFDLDIVDSGFIIVDYNLDSINYHHYEPISQSNSYIHVDDIIQDTSGGFYIFGYKEIHYFINNEVQSTIDIDENGWLFYKDALGKIYLYKENEIRYIYNHSPYTFAIIDQAILDITSYKNQHLVLSAGKLVLYNADFTQVVFEISVPSNLKSFNSFDIEEDRITYILDDNNYYELIQVDESGAQNSIFQSLKLDNTSISTLHKVSENQFLVSGVYQINDINNCFFRSCVIDRSHEYPRVDIALDNFELLVLSQDSMVGTAPSGQPFEYIDYEYKIQYTISNKGNRTVSYLPLFSSNFAFDYYNGTPRYLYLSSGLSLSPGESFTHLDTFDFIFDLSNITLNIAGGDVFMDEDYSNNTVSVDFINSTFDRNDLAFSSTLYPNPSSDYISIQTDSEVEHLSIYDNLGRLVYFLSDKLFPDKIDVSHLKSGTYYVRCKYRNNSLQSVSKFVKI